MYIVQDHDNNTGIWSDIESATRYLAKKEGELYIITGPIFQGNRLKTIGNNVFVPAHIYKLVYSPKQHKAAAYLTENAPGRNYKIVGLNELESITGLSFFLGVKDLHNAQMLELPEPKKNH